MLDNLTYEQIHTDILDWVSSHPDGVLCIYGPTASGKTSLSLRLYQDLSSRSGIKSQIISADSRQVYRYMDIGTDKISIDIRSRIPHHLIDIVNPDQIYTARDRQRDAYIAISGIQCSEDLAMIVGGTGLYIDTIYRRYSLDQSAPIDSIYRQFLEDTEFQNPGKLWQMLYDIDPLEASRHHPRSTRFVIRALEIYHHTGIPKSQYMTSQDPIYPMMMIGLRPDPHLALSKINTRIDEMVSIGLVDEVRSILDMGYSPDLASMHTIDYLQTIGYIQDKLTYDGYISALQIAHRQLAKKQRTRFRKYISDSQNSPKTNVVYKNYYFGEY